MKRKKTPNKRQQCTSGPLTARELVMISGMFLFFTLEKPGKTEFYFLTAKENIRLAIRSLKRMSQYI